jgi:hypothetical protein
MEAVDRIGYIAISPNWNRNKQHVVLNSPHGHDTQRWSINVVEGYSSSSTSIHLGGIINLKTIRGVSADNGWAVEYKFTLHPKMAERLGQDPDKVWTAKVPFVFVSRHMCFVDQNDAYFGNEPWKEEGGVKTAIRHLQRAGLNMRFEEIK